MKEDAGIICEKYPKNVMLKEDYEWYIANYDKICEEFQSDGLFFAL